MVRAVTRFFFAAWMLASAGEAACAGKRVAFVIGNSNYALAPLDNPKNDADDVAAALRRLQFEVTEGKDLTVSQFDRTFDDFITQAKAADVALFFFSGHGVQIDRRGYLAPVDTKVESESSALRELVAIQEVVSRIENSAKVSVIVLDACRDSPLQQRLRRIAVEKNKALIAPKGLPPVSVVGSNTLIVYATVPGETASDGSGRNSPFTASLLKYIETPGLEIELMFKRVTADVLTETHGKQQPERLSRLQAELMLLPALPTAVYGKSDALTEWNKSPARTNPSSKQQQTAAASPSAKLQPSEDACGDGLLVSVAQSKARPCIKPGSGKSFRDCPNCPEMVVVPAGSFTMGSPESEPERESNEGPQHKVTISEPFAVGKYAVTFAEWDACVSGGGCGGYKPKDQGWGRDDHPVINVNWNDARAYVAWLNARTAKPYRLLSEAEFEYAARSGTTTPFWWGTSITTDHANYNGNEAGGGEKGEYRQKTMRVNSFQPNFWGLYQLQGNVWTWTQDCWVDSYYDAPSDGSAKAAKDCGRRVLRGGSWNFGRSFTRAASRYWYNSYSRYANFGFRLARTLHP